ncbi:MAG: hypothetical protein GVY08_10885 [Bacteroidetes bacterium]|jgi:hypothetical protein|nr:hypothetical protein [Bacteroidota bacterium]
MSAWIWVLIPLVAIIGGYIIDYQKNKLKWQNQTNSNEAELEDMKLQVEQMKTRIENLEAIAAGDPGEFSAAGADPLDQIEIDDRQTQKEKNKTKVETIANKQR